MSKPTSQQLATIDAAAKALAKARSLDELKRVRDKAEAVRTYARSARVGLEIQNQAAELKLRAERKAGQLLSGLRLHGGDRRSSQAGRQARLDDLGISADESRRWQLLATIPERTFEKYIATTQTLGQEIAAAPLLRLARKLKKSGETLASTRAGSDGSHVQSDSIASSQEATRARPAGKEIPVSDEILEDLANHCGTLVGLVAPGPTHREPNFTPKQIYYLRSTLNEMAALLESVRRHSNTSDA